MDIRKCQLFVITAETENISKTAELTGYTQSGVSHTLKNFEEEVGVRLFARDRYGVHLTAIGQELLPYIRGLLKENEKVEQFLYDLHGYETGTLTIGTFTSVSVHWLPSILDQFQTYHPHINIRLKEGGISDIEQWIQNHEVDLGFFSHQPGQQLQFIHIMDDPIVAILPQDYPMDGRRKKFPIHEFEGKPFILSEMGVDYDIHRILEETSVHPDIRFSSKDDHAIMSMVEHHLGLSLLPELTVKGHEQNLLTMPLLPPYYRDLGIGIKDMETATPIVKKFIHFVKKYFGVDDLKNQADKSASTPLPPQS